MKVTLSIYINNNLIFTGNGGTGKSYLIRTVCKWVEKILGRAGELKPKVLRLSYAAVAASLIGKTKFGYPFRIHCLHFVLFSRWHYSSFRSWISVWT